ncbi:MAG: hypothetical protein WBO73_19680 [Gammaproteobacteria bacterium]
MLRFTLQSGAYEYEPCACSRDPGEKCVPGARQSGVDCEPAIGSKDCSQEASHGDVN